MRKGSSGVKAKAKPKLSVAGRPRKSEDPEISALKKRLAEACEQQAATSEILRTISSSPSDLQPVFEGILSRAIGLCEGNAAVLWRFDGSQLEVAAHKDASAAGVAYLKEHPLVPGPYNPTPRAALERRIVHELDVFAHPEYRPLVPRGTSGTQHSSTVIAVPLLRADELLGVITIWRFEKRPFNENQVALLGTFASQAVIAIENVRLFNETKEALEQQTAISEILRVISTSPTDVQPMLNAVVERAAKLCEAANATIFLAEGEKYRSVARFGDAKRALELGQSIPLTRGSAVGRAMIDLTTIHLEDLAAVSEDEYPMAHQWQRIIGHRTLLAVPLLRAERAIGALSLWRMEFQPFTEKQISLVKTFADQAAIAIENVRLFNETREALERQTATSEILRVISQSPADVQPVFDTIAAAALKLCGASSATVVRFDGELVHIVALASGLKPEEAAIRRLYPRPPSPDTVASRAILTGSVANIPDVLDDPEYGMQDVARSAGYRSAVGVPLMLHGKPIGAFGVARPHVGPFPEKQVALLETFADQAVIAIENVRLFAELEARTVELTRSVGELKALGEVGQAVSSTLDLETVLSTIVSRATQLAGVDGGSIYEYDAEHEEFHVRATDRLPNKLVEAMRSNPIRKGEGVLGRMAISGEPVEIPDIAAERAYRSRVREQLIRLRYRSLLAVPLLRENHILGGLVVNRKCAGAFDSQTIELLKTFATQSALAIQNARLYREIEVKSRELEAASRHKSEFLANMSHELRTPLNAIIGFSEVLSERMFGEINEKQAEYISDILQSGQHLLSLINDILDLSKIEAGRMELELSDFDLASAIENTMTLVRERAVRRGIALGRTVDERLGAVRADERKVKQVLLNLLSNALKFTPEGGKIYVRAALNDGVAEISVTDTGVGIAPEEQEVVFEEFRQVGTASKKVEGTGLGLAISRKFIELHGGRIWVKSTVGSGSTFAFTLPLQGVSPA